MSIATSLDKLSETLTNCKTNLKEKGVEADSIKISDVDEKIAEIQAGGGSGGFNYIENVTFDRQSITSPVLKTEVYVDEEISFNLTFTPKEDDLIVLTSSNLNITPETGASYSTPGQLTKSTEYKVTGTSANDSFYVVICKDVTDEGITGKTIEPVDSIIKILF